MKKKTEKKLVLAKETVRSLAALDALGQVRGGSHYPITDQSCDVFCQNEPLTTRCA